MWTGTVLKGGCKEDRALTGGRRHREEWVARRCELRAKGIQWTDTRSDAALLRSAHARQTPRPDLCSLAAGLLGAALVDPGEVAPAAHEGDDVATAVALLHDLRQGRVEGGRGGRTSHRATGLNGDAQMSGEVVQGQRRDTGTLAATDRWKGERWCPSQLIRVSIAVNATPTRRYGARWSC